METRREGVEKQKELRNKAKEILELLRRWEEALERGDIQELRETAFSILEYGDNFMKQIWTHIKPGEKLSEVAERFLSGDFGEEKT